MFGGAGGAEVVRHYLFVKPLALKIMLALTCIEGAV